MPCFKILLVVTNREYARDPEGETLAHELRTQGYRYVMGVRAGRAYVLSIDAKDDSEAIKLAMSLASRARLYNPVVHSLRVLLLAESSGGKVSRD